jgi:NADH-quinone oxidoreductase subunit L
MMLYTFHGPNRTGDEERTHLAEAPWSMTGPLVLLGIASALGGWLNLPHFAAMAGPEELLGRWLEPVVGESQLRVTLGRVPEAPGNTETFLIGSAVAIAVVGILIALVRLKPARLVPRAQAPEEHGIERVLLEKYYVDEGYDKVIVQPTVSLSRGILWRGIDQGIIDSFFVNGSAALAKTVGRVGATLQSGQVGTYAWVLVVGVLAVLGAFTIR